MPVGLALSNLPYSIIRTIMCTPCPWNGRGAAFRHVIISNLDVTKMCPSSKGKVIGWPPVHWENRLCQGLGVEPLHPSPVTWHRWAMGNHHFGKVVEECYIIISYNICAVHNDRFTIIYIIMASRLHGTNTPSTVAWNIKKVWICTY